MNTCGLQYCVSSCPYGRGIYKSPTRWAIMGQLEVGSLVVDQTFVESVPEPGMGPVGARPFNPVVVLLRCTTNVQ